MISFCHLYPNVISSKGSCCLSLWAQIAIVCPQPFYIVCWSQFRVSLFTFKNPFYLNCNDMKANENFVSNNDSLYKRSQSAEKKNPH